MPLTEATIELSGSFDVNKPVDTTYSIITDPKNIVKCLPNLTQYSIENNKINAEFYLDLSNMGLLHIRQLTVKSEIFYDSIARDMIKIRALGRGASFRTDLELSVRLTGDDKLTTIFWNSIMKVKWPLLIFYGKKFVEDLSKPIVDSIISCVKNL